MLINCITSICRSNEYRADILVWFVYASSLWSNKISPLLENLSPRRLCVEIKARPGIRPPSGHMQICIITCIRRSMESRDDLLVWFVNEIISWSNWILFPSTDPRSNPWVWWRPSLYEPEPWPPLGCLIIGYSISDRFSVPRLYSLLFVCICPTAQLCTGICFTYLCPLTRREIKPVSKGLSLAGIKIIFESFDNQSYY